MSSRFIFGSTLIAWLLVSALAHAAPSYVLVSDLDDTIKLTDVRNPLVMFGRTFFKLETFSGMAELYHGLIEETLDSGAAPRQLVVVSASPKLMGSKIEGLLHRDGFPLHRLFTRSWLKQPDTAKYKTDVLERLISESPAPLLLVGDDGEHDPEIYDAFRKKHPERVLAIYIRSIRGRSVPAGITTFRTAFELALEEQRAGRLGSGAAIDVGIELLTSADGRLMPGFEACPAGARNPGQNGARWSYDSLMQAMPLTSEQALPWLGERVNERIDAICADR